jgi:hypothetical protein
VSIYTDRAGFTYIAPEIEPERQAAPVEAAPESTTTVKKLVKELSNADSAKPINDVPLMREFPFAIDDSKCDVLIWRTSTEVQKHGFVVARLLDDLVRWCF